MHSIILWFPSIKQEVGNMLNPQILAGNSVANEDLRDCADPEQCGDDDCWQDISVTTTVLTIIIEVAPNPC